MTTPADATADERAFEACLAGRPVPDGAAGLAAFTDAVRAGATEPGRPNAALAELLVTGLLVPTQEPSRGTAGRPARTSRKRPRMLITTLVAKFAAAGAVAKAAAGTGVVVVALTGTATTVALTTPEEPAPAVETTTEVPTTTDEPTTDVPASDVPAPAGDETVPDPGDTGTEPVVEPAPEPAPVPAPEPVTGDVADPAGTALTEERWSEGPAAGQSHGDWVSEGARQGWVDGGTVSREAHERNDARKAERAAVPAPVAEEPAAELPAAPAGAEPVDGNGKGNGNGNGNGKGNGGK
ncbi:hypothetical protein [Geodermatophilus sp. DSM 45219]|uniref:hypothetical protein n=1 Tax=Geodermatophilus sp. DSM 45219 TaxID=1881103 RepID=UPI0008855491|nr:hypothetical protein [Geodermatophilus sp. DSM 45219]SDN49583.1 hypothetical protein SAMN05428965_0646 [Geodermatophilus sp. DSM 45219]